MAKRHAWIKMPLRTEVGLGLRDIVFDVNPATPRKRAFPPLNFGPCLLWPNGWMDEDAAWYGSRPRPTPHCTRRGSSSRERGTAAALFSAHIYCGHGRPSQKQCCSFWRTSSRPRPHTGVTLLGPWGTSIPQNPSCVQYDSQIILGPDKCYLKTFLI